MSLLFTPWDFYVRFGWFPQPKLSHVRIGGAPQYMHGLRALFVSDVHLRSCVSEEKLSSLVEMIAAQEADLLLLGGDYAEGEDQIARFFEALKPLRFPLGIYGVPGNNDSRAALPACMAAIGAQELRNRSVSIPLPGGKLLLGGCDDHLHGAPDTKNIFSGEGYRILISHYPVLPDCEAELMLSGHTHGGQMNLFGITPYSIGFERRFGIRALRGKTRCGNMQIAVCSGIGASRLPLRIGACPEILLLKFGK